MADNLLKDGYARTRVWCDEKIQAYHAAFPGIKNGYFAYVFDEMMSKEILTNPWGFSMVFYGERKDDSVKRDGLSFLLQSCCVFVLDLQGLIPLDFMIERDQFPGVKINNEVHDAVYASAPLDQAYDVAEFLVTNLEKPVDYAGVSLSIPATLKIGATLADEDSHEWKKFPTRDEFQREAERLFELAEKKRKDAAQWTGIEKVAMQQVEAIKATVAKQESESSPSEVTKRRVRKRKQALTPTTPTSA